MAQIEKKDWLLGGDAKFWQQELFDEILYTAELNINVGYFWHKNFVSGVRPFFNFNSNDYTAGAIVFTRYYYHFKTISPFAEVGAGYSMRTIFWTDGEVNSYTESTMLTARAGAAFFIAPKITFESYIFYDKSNSRNYPQVEGVENSTSENYALGLGLGFQFFL